MTDNESLALKEGDRVTVLYKGIPMPATLYGNPFSFGRVVSIELIVDEGHMPADDPDNGYPISVNPDEILGRLP